MRVMTQVLHPSLGKFLAVYFDDILIYSSRKERHLEHLRQLWEVLYKETLYTNVKKCVFLTPQVFFPGFVVSGEGMTADSEKIKAIVEWPEPPNIHKVLSFHGLVTFYRWFIKRFSTVMAPITNCIRKWEFHWANSVTKAFKEIKSLMTYAPVTWLSDFSKVFKVVCDVLGIDIGVLS